MPVRIVRLFIETILPHSPMIKVCVYTTKQYHSIRFLRFPYSIQMIDY